MAKKLMGKQQFKTLVIVVLSVLLFVFMAIAYLLLEMMICRFVILICFVIINAIIMLKLYKNEKFKGIMEEK